MIYRVIVRAVAPPLSEGQQRARGRLLTKFDATSFYGALTALRNLWREGSPEQRGWVGTVTIERHELKGGRR